MAVVLTEPAPPSFVVRVAKGSGIKQVEPTVCISTRLYVVFGAALRRRMLIIASVPLCCARMLAVPNVAPEVFVAPWVQLQPPVVLYSGDGFAAAVAVPVSTKATTTAATSS